MRKIILITATIPAILIASTNLYAGDNLDLDDTRHWKMVSIETCLDAALDTIPGNPRKVELKIEGDDPTYEFDIEAKDGNTYNVECNAEEGLVTEIEREVKPDDPVFKSMAKVSESDARKTALALHPGKVVAMEYEVGSDGVNFEYDIQTTLGYEVKVDIDAVTGEVEESNVEVYEIGNEEE